MLIRVVSSVVITAVACILLAGGLSPAAAAGKAQTATAKFSGAVQLKVEQPDPAHPIPRIAFSGEAAWSEPKLRVDFTQELTLEAAILIIDFDKGEAVMLYPDTLNGFTAKLSDLPGKDYLGHIRSLLQSKGASAPEGWKIVSKDKATHGGVATTHRVLEGPKGATAEYWVDGESRPVEVKVQNAKVEVSATFSGVEYGAKVPADKFTYDASAYHITKYDPESDKPAFPL